MSNDWMAPYSQHIENGIQLANQGQLGAALNAYAAAIAINPRVSVAYINRALALTNANRHHEALTDLNLAIELQPTLSIAYNNRGAVLRSLKQMDAAAKDYLKAIELGGDKAIDAYGNLATYYFEIKEFERAVGYYNKAIALQPDYGLTRWNAGMCFLLLGDFERGWREYHGRWSLESYRKRFRQINLPMWTGAEPLQGKTIVLQWEQGLGDMIQFCRYAILVGTLGCKVILEVQPAIKSLCQTLPVGGDWQVIGTDEPLPPADYVCPMMSLPMVFGTTLATIPAARSYLSADSTKVSAWQTKLGARSKPRIGIVWSSDPDLPVGPSKTVPIQDFAALVSDEFEFVSLQKNLWYGEESVLPSLGVRHFGADLIDFSDTAALCECMDLVVSVDTSVAHLSGAIGKAVFIVLHSHPDWRWLQDRSDTPWYPNAKLFRQQDSGNWNDVIASVKADMKQLFSRMSI